MMSDMAQFSNVLGVTGEICFVEESDYDLEDQPNHPLFVEGIQTPETMVHEIQTLDYMLETGHRPYDAYQRPIQTRSSIDLEKLKRSIKTADIMCGVADYYKRYNKVSEKQAAIVEKNWRPGVTDFLQNCQKIRTAWMLLKTQLETLLKQSDGGRND